MAKKLEQLTKEQEKIMHETAEEWKDFLFSCKNRINKEEAKKAINWLYEFTKLNKPLVLFFDSPLALQFAANLLANVGDNVGANVWANVWDNVRDNVGANVWDNVWDNVRDNVRANVWDNVREYYQFSGYGSIRDYGWISFYDFFQKIGIVKNSNFQKLKNLLKTGIYDMIQLKNICLVSSLPIEIHRNNGKLHHEKKFAIKFRDGYELYFWKGINVPPKLIETPELITKEDLKKNQNAEMRRCFIEKLGVSEYFKILSNGEGLKLIDKDIDNQGYPMKLMEFGFEGSMIQVLEVTCPSTERIYNLYPPNQKSRNVWDAKASTFREKKISYRHGDIGLENIGNQPDQILIET